MALDFELGEVILIDKPYTWTSFDAVRKLKNGLKIKKIGHACTLDPLATGLLIICTGKKTKTIDRYQGQEKEYTGEFVLGKTTTSVDLETPFDSETDIDFLTETIVRRAIFKFLGTHVQIPPAHSAVKVDGERVYEKARRGEEVVIKSRTIFIKEFVLTKIDLPKIEFKIVCSKGTYIRSIVRDFGVLVGTGAYLSALRRTRIGNFSVNDALEPISYINKIKISNESL